MSRPQSSLDSAYPSSPPSRSQTLSLRPASVPGSGVAGFIGRRKRQFSSLTSDPTPQSQMPPPPSRQPDTPLPETYGDDLSDVTAFRIDGEHHKGSLGLATAQYRRSLSHVSQSPPISSPRENSPLPPRLKTPTGAGRIFDSDSTVAFSDSIATPSQLPRQQTELPLLSQGQLVSDQPAPWNYQSKENQDASDDDLEVLTQKPAIFSSQRAYSRSPPPDGVEGSEDNIFYHDTGRQESYEDGSEEEEGEDRRQENGKQLYSDEGSIGSSDHIGGLSDVQAGSVNVDEEEEEEQEDFDEPEVWDESMQRPSFSREEELPPELRSNTLGISAFHSNRRAFINPDANPGVPVPDLPLHLVPPAKQPGESIGQRHMSTRERGIHPHDRNGEDNEIAASHEQRYMSTFKHPEFSKPLLNDEELGKIESLDDLLAEISSRRESTRMPSLPADKLEQELSSLASYSYPDRDETKAREFFMKMCENSYEKAGEIIATKKREIENQLLEQAAKRRKLYAEKEIEAKNLADVRVKRLRSLSATQEQLKDGVASLLQKVGLKL